MGVDDSDQGTAGAGRSQLAWGRDGYLCAGETDGLDAGAFAAAGLAVLSRPAAGGRCHAVVSCCCAGKPPGRAALPERIMKLFIRIAALALAFWTIALPASAGDYPDHAIKMIVPFAAGGGTDVLARIVAQNLNSKWGQPVVVENQPGASGAIGTRAAMKAAPDGYTLLMASTGALMAVSGSADGDGPFDVNRVLSPIAVAAAPPYLLVVSPALPVKSTAELIRLAREKPEGLTFGSSGVGAASHLSGLLFASETGTKMLHVPYKGTGPAVTDLIGGRIDVMFAPGPVVQQFVASGQLKALGVTDTKRSKFYPDIPT